MKQDCFCRIADAYVCSCCRMRWERDSARAWSRRWKLSAKGHNKLMGQCFRKADDDRKAAEARLAIAVEALRLVAPASQAARNALAKIEEP